MKRYARVVLLHPSFVHQDRIFTYSIPESLEIEVGSVVRVPLARSKTVGVVTELLDEPDVSRTVSITATIGPGLPAEIVELAAFIASKYLSSLGEALAAAMPARVAAVENEQLPRSTSRAPADLDFLREYKNGAALSRALRQRSYSGFSFQPLSQKARGPMLANLAAATPRGIIVIVPDVRTKTDVIDAIANYLEDEVAWIGSDRSPRDRYRGWLALRRAEKRIAVGGRSAVLAPVQDLGLVIVDDEAHFTHKEKRAPRFHARTVAAERARRSNAVLVAVGVPASVEVTAAVETKSMTLVAPPREVVRSERPSVEILEPGANVPSGRAITAIVKALADGRRAIVLTHRGGDEPRRILERCARATKSKRAFRIDSKTDDKELLRIVSSAELIVTTPVLAKDLVVENVEVLVIAHADAALAHPDFRAPEETFSTWWRLARFAERIIIETSKTDHPAVRALVRWDPNVLLGSEVAKRKELGYPPFGALARIIAPRDESDRIMKELEREAPDANILGPMEQGSNAIIVIRFSDRSKLAPALTELARAWRAADSNARIDVDPREIL